MKASRFMDCSCAMAIGISPVLLYVCKYPHVEMWQPAMAFMAISALAYMTIRRLPTSWK